MHVDRDKLSAKFWLSPVALARNLGFAAKELRAIARMVSEHQEEWLDDWSEYFGQ